MLMSRYSVEYHLRLDVISSRPLHGYIYLHSARQPRTTTSLDIRLPLNHPFGIRLRISIQILARFSIKVRSLVNFN